MPAMTRGPLPARVYWTRRLLVLATAGLLVFAIGRLLVGGSDASSSGDAAQLSADAPSSSAPTSVAPTTTAPTPPAPTSTQTALQTPSTSAAPTLAAPVGTCSGSDVQVTPVVRRAVAGRNVGIGLSLRTDTTEACTWRVSPASLAVDVTSGKDQIWSSRDCPRSVPSQSVVVRQAVDTDIVLVWEQAKRSGEHCTIGTGWALPGWYHVTAAALGGEPTDVQFKLTAPTAVTVTRTASPKQQPTQTATGKPTGKPTTKPTASKTTRPAKPSRSPSAPVD